MSTGIIGSLVRVFACAALLAALAPFSAAGENIAMPALSMRQELLLREFREAAPAGYAGNGIWMLERWDLDPAAELVAMPDGPGNAAAHFRRLEDLYPFERGAMRADPPPSGVDELVRAARCGECRLIPDFYPAFDSANAKTPDFTVLRSYLGSLLALAEKREKDGAIDEAGSLYEAGVVCGVHLARDRSGIVVSMTGIIFQLRSTQAYEGFLRRTGRFELADASRRVGERLIELLRLFYWKANRALAVEDEFLSLPTIVETALGDNDSAWRAHASMQLAAYRHGAPDGKGGLAGHAAWQRAAEAALERVAAEDPDPDVRRLAAWSVLHVRPGGAGDRTVFGR